MNLVKLAHISFIFLNRLNYNFTATGNTMKICFNLCSGLALCHPSFVINLKSYNSRPRQTVFMSGFKQGDKRLREYRADKCFN